MESRSDTLLRAMHMALALGRRDTLEPEQATGLGQSLGMQPEQTLEVAEQLQTDGLIHVAWGGRIALTDKGRERASGRAGGINIQLGPGSTYVGDNTRVSGAIGPGATSVQAHGAGAVANNASGATLRPAELAAALEILRSEHPNLAPEELQVVQQLESEVVEVLEESQKPHPDPGILQQRLERTKGALERLAGLGDLARNLGPVLQLIAQGAGIALGVPGI